MRDEYRRLLRTLGADVRARLPKSMETLTHLVWQGGDEGTAQKASDAGVALVSPSWVHVCDKGGVHAAEHDHPAAFSPDLYAVVADKKKRKARRKPARRKPTLEPTIDEWQDVDKTGLCFSSSQRDPPDLGLEADDLVGEDRSSSHNSGRGEAAAKAKREASSKRSNHASSSSSSSASRSKWSEPRDDDDDSGGGGDSSPPPATEGRDAPSYVRDGGGGGGGSGSAGSRSGKIGDAPLRSRSALPLASPRNTYGSGRFSRRSSEPSAAAAPVKGTAAVRAGGGGDGEEEVVEEDDDDDDDDDGWFGEDGAAGGGGEAPTEEVGVDLESTVLADQGPDEEMETGLNDTVVADDDASNTDTDSETAARAVMAETSAGRPAGRSGRCGAAVSGGGGQCPAGDHDESRCDQQGPRPSSSTAPPPEEENAVAGGAAGGDASPASPGSSEKFSSWKVGGRGLLGRGSAKKNGRLLVTGLGSAGRVGGPARASAPVLASPGLYLDGARRGGGGRARSSRAGVGVSSPGDTSDVFGMSDGDETERTMLDSTDCDSKAANRGHVSQSEADDSETDDGPADAATGGSYRKLSRRSSIRGPQTGAGGGGGGGRRQSRVSPGPSPRLAPKGVGGSGTGGITTPVSGTRRRGCSAKNPMREPESAVRGSGGAAGGRGTTTPASGYAADLSAGTSRVSKARARTGPAAGGGGGSGEGGRRSRAGKGAGDHPKEPVEGGAEGEAQDGWSCGKCTFLNELAARKCVMCQSAAPRASRRPPRARGTRNGTDPAARSERGMSSPPPRGGSGIPPAEGAGGAASSGGRGAGGERGLSSAAAAAGDVSSPNGTWEGYEMGRSTASSSAKSTRGPPPLAAPVSNRKLCPKVGTDSAGIDRDVEPSRASGGSHGKHQQGLLQGNGGIGGATPPGGDAPHHPPVAASLPGLASPGTSLFRRAAAGAVPGSSVVDRAGGVASSSHGNAGAGDTGGDSGGRRLATGEKVVGGRRGGSDAGVKGGRAAATLNTTPGGGQGAGVVSLPRPCDEEEGSTAPAIRLFEAVPSPSTSLLGRPPPDAAVRGAGAETVAAGTGPGVAGAAVDGAGLRDAARGGDDGGRDLAAAGERDGDEEAGEGETGGMEVAPQVGGHPRGNDADTAEESDTETVQRSCHDGSSPKEGGSPADDPGTEAPPGGQTLLERAAEEEEEEEEDASAGGAACTAAAAVVDAAQGSNTERTGRSGVGERRGSARLRNGGVGGRRRGERGRKDRGVACSTSPLPGEGQEAKDGGAPEKAVAAAGVDGAGRGDGGDAVREDASAAPVASPSAAAEEEASAATAGTVSVEDAAPAGRAGSKRRASTRRGVAASVAAASSAVSAGRGGSKRRVSTRGAAAASAPAAGGVASSSAAARVADALSAGKAGPVVSSQSLDDITEAVVAMSALVGEDRTVGQPGASQENANSVENHDTAAAQRRRQQQPPPSQGQGQRQAAGAGSGRAEGQESASSAAVAAVQVPMPRAGGGGAEVKGPPRGGVPGLPRSSAPVRGGRQLRKRKAREGCETPNARFRTPSVVTVAVVLLRRGGRRRGRRKRQEEWGGRGRGRTAVELGVPPQEGAGEGERSDKLQGVVRVVFSGLQPGDRQAAASVVRSLSKTHRPHGSGVCMSDAEAYTHLVIPDVSRRTLKVLFALCAPLSPNGRPPVVVTVAWLYESLEKGFFVDSEAFRPDRYRGPALEGGSVEGPEEGGSATAAGATKESRSISSSLLQGERVMLGGIADPPPSVVETLALATGGQITHCLHDATLLLAETETALEAWVEQQKKPEASGGGGGGSGSRGVSKISARPGGNSIGTGRRGLGASTASSRNASRGAAGGRRGVLGKGKGSAAAGPGGWGEEEESALKGLAEKLGVVRLPWLFDSVEKGVRVDKENFLIMAEGTSQSGAEGDATASQEW
ncbi:expressed unknown protein [Ectocarpus siliculosus]|uniref:BRCT domain-containing protein n=1 Tax=Ectocarpus siliculosus TaxID=2880 RepID=D7G1G0_ECTSI|nr:expressed unknown protein [Ectocarpus siliculosus]|eukprot:CBJ26768.1 expressed unknown protein [Ectocarpus siliculosus]